MANPASEPPSPLETSGEKRAEDYGLRQSAKPSFRHGALLFGGVVLILVAVAAGLAVHARMKAETRLTRETRTAAAMPVAVIYPAPIVTTEEISLPGSAQANQDTALYARTSGYLKNWKVDIGAKVKSGDLLAEIETPEVDRQLEQARADRKNAEANFDLAQVTAMRAQALFKNNAVSSQERDQAQSDLAAKRALVDAGEANVRRLEQLQSFEKVYAPFDGVITARNTDVGALIQAGDSGTSAKELFHIADTRTLRVYFSVPEIYAASVKAGEKVPITFDAFPNEKFMGTLVRDAASIDTKTHTLMTEADVENQSGHLFAGGYATVHLRLPAAAGGVMVPSNTMLFRAEGTRVAVVREGRAVLVPIVIGRDHGNTVEVRSGLTSKDAVIIDPSDSLEEGAPVQIENGSSTSPAAASS